MKILLIINSVLAVLFGIAFIVIPEQLISLYSDSNPGMEYIGQLYGSALIAIACITWLVKDSEDRGVINIIGFSLFISFAIGFVVTLIGQLQNVVNLLGWTTVAIYFFLSVGYGYFRFKKPTS